MTAPIRVLVVDDDFRVAGLHSDIVADHAGYIALPPALTVGAALAKISTESPDLILVDVHLPDGDGIELIRKTKVDAFVISAAAEPETVRRALRAGASSLLLKPFTPKSLGERLDRYRRYRNLVSGSQPLRQDSLDRALAVLHGLNLPSTSAGRSATEVLILNALEDGDASASQVAQATGLSRATAQRYLAAMTSRSILEVHLNYGTTGRPEHRYQLNHPSPR